MEILWGGGGRQRILHRMEPVDPRLCFVTGIEITLNRCSLFVVVGKCEDGTILWPIPPKIDGFIRLFKIGPFLPP